MALVGAGYWGTRLARNLAAQPRCVLHWVCDVNRSRAEAVGAPLGAGISESLDEVLDDRRVEAVVIATPATAHESLARRCLATGRHLLVTKPLALSVAGAESIGTSARDSGLVVMCDHTYRFAPVVRAVRAHLSEGSLGALVDVESVRTNYQHGQPDVDVLWDLGHHDVSILTYVLPPSARPVAVSAGQMDLAGLGRAHAASLTLHLAGGAEARITLDWWAESKVRTMSVTGADAVLRWNDQPTGHDGLRLALQRGPDVHQVRVEDRREPLALVVDELFDAIDGQRPAVCGPDQAREVLHVLERASRSAAAGGAIVPLGTVDEPIGITP